MKTSLIAVVVGLSLNAVVLGQEAREIVNVPVPPKEAQYVLNLENGISQGKALEVYLDLRDSKIAGGFVLAPKFNRMPGTVDVSGLQVDVGSLKGSLTVSIPSDGYNPPDGKPFVTSLIVDTRIVDGAVTGTNYVTSPDPVKPGELICTPKGAVSGQVQVPAPDTDRIRVELNCENVLNHSEKMGGARRARFEFSFKDGKAYGAKMVPPGSLTDVACGLRVTGVNVTLVAGRMQGTIEAVYQAQDAGKKADAYVYGVDGRFIGEKTAGTLAIQFNGAKLMETGSFTGTVTRGVPVAAGEALMKLTLHDLLGAGKFADLYLTSAGGKILHGFGTTPNFNNATHDLDVSGLTLEANRLSGKVGITVQPDPWIPRDHKAIPCAVTLNGTVDGWEVVDGAFTGTAGTNAVKGPMDGGLQAKKASGAMTAMTLKLENGLMGANEWMSRAFLSVEIADGKVTGGKVWNNHNKKLTGTVDSGELRIQNEKLTGSLKATVTEGGGVSTGKYEFTVDGVMVGTAGAGTFTTVFGEKSTRGRFWCSGK